MQISDSPLYSCAILDPKIYLTGDEDEFIKMWYNRLGDTSVITFKRFCEYVSLSYCRWWVRAPYRALT